MSNQEASVNIDNELVARLIQLTRDGDISWNKSRPYASYFSDYRCVNFELDPNYPVLKIDMNTQLEPIESDSLYELQSVIELQLEPWRGGGSPQRLCSREDYLREVLGKLTSLG